MLEVVLEVVFLTCQIPSWVSLDENRNPPTAWNGSKRLSVSECGVCGVGVVGVLMTDENRASVTTSCGYWSADSPTIKKVKQNKRKEMEINKN